MGMMGRAGRTAVMLPVRSVNDATQPKRRLLICRVIIKGSVTILMSEEGVGMRVAEEPLTTSWLNLQSRLTETLTLSSPGTVPLRLAGSVISPRALESPNMVSGPLPARMFRNPYGWFRVALILAPVQTDVLQVMPKRPLFGN